VDGGSITKEIPFNLNIIEDCSQVTATATTSDDIIYAIGSMTEVLNSFTINEFTTTDSYCELSYVFFITDTKPSAVIT
jgi:hypothetical protein